MGRDFHSIVHSSTVRLWISTTVYSVTRTRIIQYITVIVLLK